MISGTDGTVQTAPRSPRRGTLRVYLGAAPGVGKTYAMLNEGRRAKERGRDVVVGFVETYGRRLTEQAIGDLEVIPRKQVSYRGSTFEEMDIDAILARRPERVLVDELAHTNVPGCRNEKRWGDVEELLAAGIDVISTLNIQHLESINDVVERITGIRQRETIPDEIVRQAEQVELVDITPEALRRRMAHGNIYAHEKIDSALANYFRAGNLGALRELALLWVADKVDVGLEEYRERHGITEPWETRERVVAALTGAPGTEGLIRRAARIAQRAHGELVGVHVHSDEGLAGSPTALLEQHRKLLQDMGGEFHEVAGADVAGALVDFALAENATQLVLGASQRSRLTELIRGSVINRVVRLSGPIDVHVISHEHHDDDTLGTRRPPPRRGIRSPIAPRRQLAAWLLAIAGVPLLTLILAQLREEAGLPTVLLIYLALVVTTAATGGTWPAVVAAITAVLAANWYFTPPLYRWTIAEAENVIALFVFLGIALIVSRFVDVAARRTIDAARARSQARSLARLAATMGEEDPLHSLLEHLRTLFGVDAAALLRRAGDRDWRVEAAAGEPVPVDPGAAATVEEIAPDLVLVLASPSISAEDQLVLNAFGDQLATVLEQSRLRAEAGRASALAEADALRNALLEAVSHDLRSPLASIKAAATSLKSTEVKAATERVSSVADTVDEGADCLTALVGHLLDLSRIRADALRPTLSATPLEEVLSAAVSSLDAPSTTIDIDVPDTLPPVLVDSALLERALANIIDNAVRYSPPERPVRVEAGEFAGRVDVRVIDQGPGIPIAQRERVLLPLERLAATRGTGAGLGLAVARAFLTAIGATVEIDDTPGGGTTVVVTIPVTESPTSLQTSTVA